MGFLERLLDVELGLPARFIIAFIVVLLLIAITAWIIRRISAGRGGAGGVRTRQHRLAVVDSAHIDAKRKLVIVRRDDTEHLILIGGPSDVVVETRIGQYEAIQPERPAPSVQTQSAQPPRPAEPPRAAAPPIPPRPSRPAPPPPQAPPPIAAPPVAPAPAHVAPPRPAAPPPPPIRPAPPPVSREEPKIVRGDTGPRVSPPSPAAPLRQETPPPPPPPSAAPPPQAQQPQRPVVTPTVPSPAAPEPRPVEAATQSGSRDPQLDEMAQRLEAALKRPLGPAGPRPAPPEDAPPPASQSDLARAVVDELDLEDIYDPAPPPKNEPTSAPEGGLYDDTPKRDD